MTWAEAVGTHAQARSAALMFRWVGRGVPVVLYGASKASDDWGQRTAVSQGFACSTCVCVCVCVNCWSDADGTSPSF